MFIRNVKKSDKNELQKLFKSCFGRIAEINGSLEPIDSRYKVAIEDDKIVAVSGILPVEKSNYQGYEITWTCCDIRYRGRGYITALLRECLKELPDDNIPLYCSCWRIQSNPFINMIHVMRSLGFEEVARNRLNYIHGHSKECKGCLYDCDKCFCCEDLWKLDRNTLKL